MKKYLTLIFLFSFINLLFSQESKNKECKPASFIVYLNDKAKGYSNVRESPNGYAILKLDNKYDDYILTIVDIKNSWLKVSEINALNGYDITNLEAWIHTSIVGAGVTHNLDVFNKPNGKTKIGMLKGEEDTFKIKDIHCKWIQIECNGLIGWVESAKICGNPVTTCP